MNGMVQAFVRNAQVVLTRPATASFDVAEPYANWNVILVTLAIAAVARGALGAISGAYTSAALFAFGRTTAVSYHPIATFFGDAIGTFIGFFVGAGILYLIARAFSGTGNFLNHSHALALIIVPVTIADAVFGLVPILGGLASFALGIYAIYLAVLAIASAHRLPVNRAVWVVLIPVFAGVVLALCAVVVAGAFLFAATRH